MNAFSVQPEAIVSSRTKLERRLEFIEGASANTAVLERASTSTVLSTSRSLLF